VKLTIDHISVEVQEGLSVLEAAASLGIDIPTMCFKPGFTNHPSCMVCLVKEVGRDNLVPSCSMPVAEGMDILTGSEEVIIARREALELLLSDHIGDCEAPCRLTCPAFMDIPLMNRLIARGDFVKALRIVREEIAIPFVLGTICPAPCEKACKRRPIDQAVSICLLKRSAAEFGEVDRDLPKSTGKKIAIIGTGPAGLSTAFYLLQSGHSVVLFDLHEKAGGTLQYDIPEDHLPREILQTEIDTIRNMGAEFRLGTLVTHDLFHQTILPQFDAVILATGSRTINPPEPFGIGTEAQVDKHTLSTTIPGVFACGSIIREQRMAVQSAAQGKLAAQQVERYFRTMGAHVLQAGISDHLQPCIMHDHPVSQGDPHTKHRSVSAFGPLFEPEFKEYLREAIPGHRMEPAGSKLQGFTREEAIREALRCMHCDCRKPVSCKLKQYAEQYDASRKRFAVPDRNLLTRSVQHDLVVFETEKCIRCGLCVEITSLYGESIGLTFAGRGFDVRISVPFNETIKAALTITARECVESCPTGALAFKEQEERNSL